MPSSAFAKEWGKTAFHLAPVCFTLVVGQLHHTKLQVRVSGCFWGPTKPTTAFMGSLGAYGAYVSKGTANGLAGTLHKISRHSHFIYP